MDGSHVLSKHQCSTRHSERAKRVKNLVYKGTECQVVPCTVCSLNIDSSHFASQSAQNDVKARRLCHRGCEVALCGKGVKG